VANAESRGDDDDVRVVRDLNARIAVDPRVASILVPAYDGFLVAIVDRR
jgi:predicted O-methyltransferase YrrM